VKICDDGMRRGDWPIGRIVKLHPGEDGVVRVVTIRCCHGYYKRPMVMVMVAKIVLNDMGLVRALAMRSQRQRENVEDESHNLPITISWNQSNKIVTKLKNHRHFF
jgi:hypothetical protein